jgi:hypothetical protein
MWFRAIPKKHWKTALRTDHTSGIVTRYNPGAAAKTPYEILYLAENPTVALYEVGAIFGPPDRPIPNPEQRYSIIEVNVSLQSIVDLTDASQQGLLDVSLQELTGNWDTYDPGAAPTQRLGAALFATKGVEGLVAISAKMPRCRTLIVFPEKLRMGSGLIFEDPILRKTHRIDPR